MGAFTDFISRIESPENKARLEAVLLWVKEKFPGLETRVAWNQPMFTHHGTFIIGFSLAKHHMAVAPERVAVEKFAEEMDKSGYSHTRELMRIPWDRPVDYDLLEKIIAFNIEDKEGCTTFWRK